jgi:hypothetical protein
MPIANSTANGGTLPANRSGNLERRILFTVEPPKTLPHNMDSDRWDGNFHV